MGLKSATFLYCFSSSEKDEISMKKPWKKKKQTTLLCNSYGSMVLRIEAKIKITQDYLPYISITSLTLEKFN